LREKGKKVAQNSFKKGERGVGKTNLFKADEVGETRQKTTIIKTTEGGKNEWKINEEGVLGTGTFETVSS